MFHYIMLLWRHRLPPSSSAFPADLHRNLYKKISFAPFNAIVVVVVMIIIIIVVVMVVAVKIIMIIITIIVVVVILSLGSPFLVLVLRM